RNNPTQASLIGALVPPLTDAMPLAFTAARKSERRLAKRLALMPAATGLTSASRLLIASKSSRMAAGSCPMRIATRVGAERRSRKRVGLRSALCSSALTIAASVMGSADAELRWGKDLVLGFFDMASSFREAERWTGMVSGGQPGTQSDFRDI